jgi:hypothetical protein
MIIRWIVKSIDWGYWVNWLLLAFIIVIAIVAIISYFRLNG